MPKVFFLRTFTARILPIVVLVALTACNNEGPKSPSGPTDVSPPPQQSSARAVVTLTNVSATGQTKGSGFSYTVLVSVRESGGARATFSAWDLTFAMGSSNQQARFSGADLSTAGSSLEANASTILSFTVDDTTTPHPFASSVRVSVTYTDATGASRTTTGDAAVPPLSAPPPASSFTLNGHIKDAKSGRTLAAKVELRNGSGGVVQTANAGADGFYQFVLASGNYVVKGSAAGYDDLTQSVSMTRNVTVDLNLNPAGSGGPTPTPPSGPGGSPVPPVTPTSQNTNGRATVTIVNNTGYQIEVSFSGPATRTVTLGVGGRQTVNLTPGGTFSESGRVLNPPAHVVIAPFQGSVSVRAGWSHEQTFVVR